MMKFSQGNTFFHYRDGFAVSIGMQNMQNKNTSCLVASLSLKHPEDDFF